MLETLTIEKIMGIRPRPCYNPVGRGYMNPDWEGTIVDFLKIEEMPSRDRIWVACHGGFIDDKTLRLFAVWCAREALKTIKNPDSRSVKACDVAEAYACGKTTEEELRKAQNAAWKSVYITTDAAHRTVYNATHWATDWAAYKAAYYAAYNATYRAAYKAVDREKEHRKKIVKLIEMVRNYG